MKFVYNSFIKDSNPFFFLSNFYCELFFSSFFFSFSFIRIEKEQLGQIFELLKQQEEEFKLSKMEAEDLKAQLKIYR